MAKRSHRPHRKSPKERATRSRKAQVHKRLGPEIPKRLTGAIEAQRGRLMQANSIAQCLAISLTYGDDDPTTGPYFPDVAEVVSELIEQALSGLDSVSLREALSVDEVKDGAREAWSVSWADPATDSADSTSGVKEPASSYGDASSEYLLPPVRGGGLSTVEFGGQ